MAFYHPLLFAMDAERAHRLTIRMLSAWGAGGTPFGGQVADPALATRVAGVDFANPVGLAAGVDKDGEAIGGFFGLGFGSVEVGTLTPLPQPGNPTPRLFRLVEDRAVINRYGFNNGGIDAAMARVRRGRFKGTLGINVGANKDARDRIADYVAGVTRARGLADYLTINISSPNTPGLRDLQHGAALSELIAAAVVAAAGTPVFLKVAPDLELRDIDGIARAAIDGGIAALIVSNTTVTRTGLRSPDAAQAGGLSGAPLAPLARQRLSEFRVATGGKLPLVSVGGIGDADEAWARIRAGASLIQLYTALVYEGPGLAHRIAAGLAERARRAGFASVADAVGTG